MNRIDNDTHKARGTYRADKHAPKADPVPAVPAVPSAPSWLSAGGRDHWPAIAGDLHAAGLLTRVDVSTVGMLCDALAGYITLRDQLAEADPIVQGGRMQRAHPLIGSVKEARDSVITLARECGMTPKARRGLKIEAPAPKAGEIKPFGGGFAT